MKKIIVIVLAVVLVSGLLLTSVVLGASYSLTMSAWREKCDCAYQGKCWCGPCSAVSIGRYYREVKQYSQLPWSATTGYYPMYCDLCSRMGIVSGAPVYPYMYGPGFVGMTKYSGYHNFGHTQDYFSQVEMGTMEDFWQIKDSIDKGWPVALFCGGQFAEELSGGDRSSSFPPSGAHWVAIRGYRTPDAQCPYYVIRVTDSASGKSDLWLNWKNLGNVGASTWYFCTIKDTVIDDFEWGYDGRSLSASGGSITWTVQKAGSSVAEIDTDVAFTGTKSARFYRDGSNDVKAYYSLVKPSYIGFYIRKQNAANADAYIGDGTRKLYTRINSSQDLQYYDATGWHTVCRLYQIASSGYLIEYKNINWTTGRYDICVDGDLKKSGASMQTTTADKDKMCFANLVGSGSFWIDDIFQS